jgi:integrase
LPILSDNVEKLDNESYKKEIGRKTGLLNKYIKKVAFAAGIEKNVTSHIARHIANKKSYGNITFVQTALKHTDPKITQAYLADLDDESMDDAMSNVMDF